MLKKEITYEDFNGDQVTEALYFNLSKPELIKLDVEYKDGLSDAMRRIIKADDKQAVVKEFERIILLSYGEKSPDGKRFVKSDEIRDSFLHSAAYEVLFMELITDTDSIVTFIKGVLPKDFGAEVDKAADQMRPAPPVPPIRSV